MELNFCDLCQEAVPQADLDTGGATLNGRRVICRQCHGAMGSTAAGKDDATSAGAKSAVKRKPALVSPSIAAVLAIASILLSLFAVVILLVRIEAQDGQNRQEAERMQGRITYLEERQAGTRDGMIARAKQAGEDAIYPELERFETFERQLQEIREALINNKLTGAAAPAELGASPLVQQLAASDQNEQVLQLEQQVLFLQARVFELLETSTREGARKALGEPAPKLLLPSGELGELVTQLTHKDPIERVSALYALARTKDVGVVRHVTPLLDDPDAYIRALSARILERMQARSSVQSLIDALGDVDAMVREAAVSALRSITAHQFQFDPRGPGAERFRAAKRWKAWWTENWKTFLYQDS